MNKFSLPLLSSVAVLFAIGLLMVFNTTSADVLNRRLDIHTHHALIKQFVYALLSLLAAAGIWMLGYRHLIQLSPALYILCFVLLLLVFVPGIGGRTNGASRWIHLGPITFQPSEFVKTCIPLFYLYALFSREKPYCFKSFAILMGVLALPLLLILVEPDNGTAVIILMTIVVLFFLTRIRWTYWALPLLVIILVGVGFALRMEHVADRINIYLHPEADLLGKGHQPYQAKIAAGSGQLYGKGVGESLQKLNYLPEARSDYIAAIYAEEFGYLGMLFLVLLYMLIAFFGFQIANRSLDREGFYLAASMTFLVSFQGFLNLGIVSGMLPSKGTNLPFFSQGGSSLLTNAIAVTIILNVAKFSSKKKMA
ncbi:MAG: putative lipid II flippase FtsW [Simkaniaceae bacterium]|nr:putative lipid II flippase FtsW [Simkaniaceae bacterium]